LDWADKNEGDEAMSEESEEPEFDIEEEKEGLKQQKRRQSPTLKVSKYSNG